MRSLRVTRMILPALLLLAAACTEWNDMPQEPCRGGSRIYGIVSGGSGPIAGVEVRAEATDRSAYLESETEFDGTYELLVPPGTFS